VTDLPLERRCACDCPSPEDGYDESWEFCPYCGATLVHEEPSVRPGRTGEGGATGEP
jgi:hypothetical protein